MIDQDAPRSSTAPLACRGNADEVYATHAEPREPDIDCAVGWVEPVAELLVALQVVPETPIGAGGRDGEIDLTQPNGRPERQPIARRADGRTVLAHTKRQQHFAACSA